MSPHRRGPSSRPYCSGSKGNNYKPVRCIFFLVWVLLCFPLVATCIWADLIHVFVLLSSQTLLCVPSVIREHLEEEIRGIMHRWGSSSSWLTEYTSNMLCIFISYLHTILTQIYKWPENHGKCRQYFGCTPEFFLASVHMHQRTMIKIIAIGLYRCSLSSSTSFYSTLRVREKLNVLDLIQAKQARP